MSDVTETVEIATLNKEWPRRRYGITIQKRDVGCNRDRGDSHTEQRNGRGEGSVYLHRTTFIWNDQLLTGYYLMSEIIILLRKHSSCDVIKTLYRDP